MKSIIASLQRMMEGSLKGCNDTDTKSALQSIKTIIWR